MFYCRCTVQITCKYCFFFVLMIPMIIVIIKFIPCINITIYLSEEWGGFAWIWERQEYRSSLQADVKRLNTFLASVHCWPLVTDMWCYHKTALTFYISFARLCTSDCGGFTFSTAVSSPFKKHVSVQAHIQPAVFSLVQNNEACVMLKSLQPNIHIWVIRWLALFCNLCRHLMRK